MKAIEFLNREILSCSRCSDVEVTYTHTGKRKERRAFKYREGVVPVTESSSSPVPGSGNPNARVLCLGEAPGEDEDEAGEGFIGKSGRYLRQRLLPMAGVRTADCRFANVIRCHPIANRDPYAGEITTCSKWLDLEIELVNPEVILCIGRFATQAMLPGVKLKESHGQVFEKNGRYVIPLYHAAALDRSVSRRVLERDYRGIPGKLNELKRGDQTEREFVLVQDEETYKELISTLRDSHAFGFDIETNESEWARQVKKAPDPITNELAGMSFSFGNETVGYTVYYLPTCDYADEIVSFEDIAPEYTSWEELIAGFFQDTLDAFLHSKIYIHNAKFEMSSLSKYHVIMHNIFCTYLAAYTMSEETLGLKDITKRRYGVQQTAFAELVDLKTQQTCDAKLTELWPYGCADAYWCHRYGLWAEKEMAGDQRKMFFRIASNLLPWASRTELEGMEIDEDRRLELVPIFEDKLEELGQEILNLAGVEFNLNASKQKADVLYDHLGIEPPSRPTRGGGTAPIMTDSGAHITTNKDHLKPIAFRHEIIPKMLEHASLVTINSTFVTGMPKHIHPETCRIHPSINQCMTDTSRFSYTAPNCQNIPVRVWKELREMWAAEEIGWVIWAIDQSQIELRWAAHLSQDPWMLEVLRDLSRSIHKETCQEIYQIDEDDPKWENQYKNSKNGNFARLFGAEKYKLAETLEVSVEEAAYFLAMHRRLMPGFDEHVTRTNKMVRNRGYTETAFGFRRYLPAMTSKNRTMRSAAERQAVNTPIQGSAANHMWIAIHQAYEFLQGREFYSRILFNVHDELVGTSPIEELEEVTSGIADIMTNCVEIDVPTPVEIEVGPNWGKVIPISEWTEQYLPVPAGMEV